MRGHCFWAEFDSWLSSEAEPEVLKDNNILDVSWGYWFLVKVLVCGAINMEFKRECICRQVIVGCHAVVFTLEWRVRILSAIDFDFSLYLN